MEIMLCFIFFLNLTLNRSFVAISSVDLLSLPSPESVLIDYYTEDILKY